MMKIKEFQGIKKYKFNSDDTDTNAVRLRELKDLAKYLPKNKLNLEFGVFSGTTINCLAEERPDLQFHGFDSFEGLPEDWDMGQKNVDKKAFDMQGSVPMVEKNVKLWKGWFDKTIPEFLDSEHNTTEVGYLHVDCDLYSSTVTILEDLNHLIVPGTIIRFDELACWRHVFGEASPKGKSNRVRYTTWKDHEWKALNEWLDKFERKVVPISRNWFQGATVMVTQ
jgi:hypothetical protein